MRVGSWVNLADPVKVLHTLRLVIIIQQKYQARAVYVAI